jgi:hypothetical protein
VQARVKAQFAFKEAATKLWGFHATSPKVVSDVEKQFATIRGDLFPGKSDEDMSAMDWVEFANRGPEKLVPF